MNAVFGPHPLAPFGAYSSWSTELAVATGVLLLCVTLGARRLDGLAELLFRLRSSGRPRHLAAGVILVVLILCLAVAGLVLQRFPNSADEYGDLFLAETLSQGRLWNPLPEHAEFFRVIHIAQKDGKWVARYPPGWPAILALGSLLRFPAWALNPIIAALTLALLWRFAERFVGSGAGPIAVLLAAASGYFVFTASSFRSHVSASFWILAGAYLVARFAEDRRVRHGVLGGLAFGLAFATRPYTALLCGLPFAGYLLVRRRDGLGQVGYVLLGAVPGVAGLLLYNYMITGDPLLLVTTWMDPNEGLGFRNGHTVQQGALHAARRLAAFVEWTNPALLFVFVACAWRLWSGEGKRLFSWMSLPFPALVVGHFFFYAFGGTQYGPRFYYEAYPFVVLVVVQGLADLTRSTGDGSIPASRWPRRALLAGLLFSVLTLPFTAVRLHRVVDQRRDVFELVQRQGVDNAVVFIASPTGTIWPMPVQDLVRNGTRIGGRVIYAHDRGDLNRELQQAYPQRNYFRYVRDAGSPYGRLEPATPLPRPRSD